MDGFQTAYSHNESLTSDWKQTQDMLPCNADSIWRCLMAQSFPPVTLQACKQSVRFYLLCDYWTLVLPIRTNTSHDMTQQCVRVRACPLCFRILIYSENIKKVSPFRSLTVNNATSEGEGGTGYFGSFRRHWTWLECYHFLINSEFTGFPLRIEIYW